MRNTPSRCRLWLRRTMLASVALGFTVVLCSCGNLPFTATAQDRAAIDLRAFVASKELAMRMLADPNAEVISGPGTANDGAERFIVFQVRNRSRFHVWGRVHCEGAGLGRDGNSFDIAASAPNTWTVNVIDARGRFGWANDGQPIAIRWLTCYTK